jgi:hypothetical protein
LSPFRFDGPKQEIIMTQDPNDNSSFTVENGEQATVTLQAIQCNCNTSGGFDGAALAKQSADPDSYAFQVNGNSGDTKVFASLCEFLPSDPVTSHYTVQISGSQGGNFAASSVFKETPEASFQLYFTIA